MPDQNLNLVSGGNLLGGHSRTPGSQEEIGVEAGDVAENGDGDPRDPGSGSEILPLTPKECQSGFCPKKRWASLFGVKPSGKSSFPLVKVISNLDRGSFSIAIPDKIVDYSIASMASTLVGKFVGQRPNIDAVRDFARKKWHLKGQVSITAMAKGFLAFDFTCKEDMSFVLRESPWSFG